MLVLYLLTLKLSVERKDISQAKYKEKIKSVLMLPKLIKETLSTENEIQEAAKDFAHAKGSMFLGRGYSFPIALEGALKLKELAYVHAEGYPAGEMKHGPLALIEQGMPVVVIATRKGNYHKIVSNVMEIKARGGKVIAVVTKGDKEIKKIADDVIEIPEADELIIPILANIPLQLLSYHIANLKNCEIDQPRNLAKSVTVE